MSEIRVDKLIAKTSASSIKADRSTSDGSIIELQKDGTTVGSIGAENSDLYIESTATNHSGITFLGSSLRPRYNGATSDNIIDIGSSTMRFNNLYLGGNIYLGGTGSANALSDYEEGTWTPTIISGTATFSNVGYIKVGNLVTARLFVTTFSDTTSSNTLQFDLPFTVKASTGTTTGSAMSRNIITLGDGLSSYVQQNASLLRVYQNNSGGAWALLVHSDLNASSQIYINITYEAN